MADYLKLLRELATIEPPLFVFGGVAEAALLDGRLDPSHGDVDLLTPRIDVEHRIERLGDFGFAPFEVYYEPRPGLPLVYGTLATISCSNSAFWTTTRPVCRTSRFPRTKVSWQSLCQPTCSIGH